MPLHLVGGFLGSGKTTAIVGAAQQFMARGKRVGVVTNVCRCRFSPGFSHSLPGC